MLHISSSHGPLSPSQDTFIHNDICPVRAHFPIVLDKEMLMEINIFCIKLSVTYNIIRTIISIKTRVYLHSGNIPWVEKLHHGK